MSRKKPLINIEVTPDDNSNRSSSTDKVAVMNQPSPIFFNKTPEMNEQIRDLISYSQQQHYCIPDFTNSLLPLKENRKQLFDNPTFNSIFDINSEVFYAMKLREEAISPGGVIIELIKSEFCGLRVVLSYGSLWLTKSTKSEYSKIPFHTGDNLISIDSEIVRDLDHMKSIIDTKHKYEKLVIRLRRFPFGKVFTVKVENYSSVLNFNEEHQAFELSEIDKAEETNNSRDSNLWFITEIKGITITDFSNQKKLHDYLSKTRSEYVSIVVHKKEFITDYLKLSLMQLEITKL